MLTITLSKTCKNRKEIFRVFEWNTRPFKIVFFYHIYWDFKSNYSQENDLTVTCFSIAQIFLHNWHNIPVLINCSVHSDKNKWF